MQTLGKTGSRSDFLARVIGPGETDYNFPVAISDTILAIWGDDPADTAEQLVETLVRLHGTSSAFPGEGYWFDSYNSESTLTETKNKIHNFGGTPFLKHRAPADAIAAIFGGDILDKLEQLSHKFFLTIGQPLIGSLDYSFERSEADSDLGSPPNNKAELLYRVCILSVLIDGFRLRLPTEPNRNGSLAALKNWFERQYDASHAAALTETFKMIKNLRKQYPIHEHFERDQAGQRVVRDEVVQAEQYFGFRDIGDMPAKYKRLTDTFKKALDDIADIIEPAAGKTAD